MNISGGHLVCPFLQNGPPRLEGKATNPPKVEHAFLSRQRERLEASCSVVTFERRESWGLIQKSDKFDQNCRNNCEQHNLCIKNSMDVKLYEILGLAGRLVMAGICFGTFPVLSGGKTGKPNSFRGRHGQRLGKPCWDDPTWQWRIPHRRSAGTIRPWYRSGVANHLKEWSDALRCWRRWFKAENVVWLGSGSVWWGKTTGERWCFIEIVYAPTSNLVMIVIPYGCLGWFVLLGFPHYVPIFDWLSHLYCSFNHNFCSGHTVCAGKITILPGKKSGYLRPPVATRLAGLRAHVNKMRLEIFRTSDLRFVP